MPGHLLEVQIAVLGGGPAGYVAAIRAAQLNASVVLIEKQDLGGVCMNIGCIPTKALVHTADVAATLKKSKEFGIESQLDFLNWGDAVKRKDRIVQNLNLGLGQLLREKGIAILSGKGTVLSACEIAVEAGDETTVVHCEKLVLPTGSAPLLPPIPGIHLRGVITSTEELKLAKLPQSIAIIGAGVIGLELPLCLLRLA